MDKNMIKKYAVWARLELISRVKQKAQQFGIEEDKIVDASADTVHGHVLSATEKAQRQALIAQIQAKTYQQVIEEVAYTWFNRFSALRFMEVNGYLPSHVRVFTDEDNNFKPQILTEAINLELEGLDMAKVYALKNANDDDALFKYMIIVQCNGLSGILPGMFQRISDYTELLFPDNLLRQGSVIEQMVSMIPEEDWTDQVQIIGWLYQYYNTEPKDKVFADLKKNIKITKENIPAATQLFTPDWIVRYMVENSLGRLWLEGHPNDALKSEWKYYLDEAEQEPEVQAQLEEIRKEYAALKPEDIKCIDPCMGSGHILCYLFDVLVRIYEDYGYTAREAVSNIVAKNLWGLDIDQRAAQLAYFAVMMKARQYDRRFLSRKNADGYPDVPQPHVYAIVESNGLAPHAIAEFVGEDPALKKAMDSILKEMWDAKEYGSILNITPVDFDALYTRFDQVYDEFTLNRETILNELLPLVWVAEMLAQRYDVVVTNPPYMGSGGMGAKLADFAKKNYPDSKSDLSTCFMEKSAQLCNEYGYYAMINIPVWMFLSSFEKLRQKMLMQNTILSMVHPGRGIFGSDFGTTTFVISKKHIDRYNGTYRRLFDKQGEVETIEERERAFLFGKGAYTVKQDNFSIIPGTPVAYWASDNLFSIYRKGQIGDKYSATVGIQTGNNDMFLKFWFEVSYHNISFSMGSNDSYEIKWYPHPKGGAYRKWYGNYEYVVNWQNDGEQIRKYNNSSLKVDKYKRNGVCWSHTTSGAFSSRLFEKTTIPNLENPVLFCEGADRIAILAYFNTKLVNYLLNLLNSTLHYHVGDILRLPILEISDTSTIDEISHHCINLAKTDWDSFENSWDFQRHPLVSLRASGAYAWGDNPPTMRISAAYKAWELLSNGRFQKLKANEEKLNRIFIDIYGLQDELTPEVEDKDVTVRKADLQRDIRSFISYAVGCMFGRYSLDKPGLVYAGGAWDEVYRKDRLVDESGNTITFGGVSLTVGKEYTYVNNSGKWEELSFCPDKDNIIPICDDEYFEDDIVGRFIKFIEVVYGKDTLDENLCFIADALGGKGQPKDVIRSYFLNDFYADHLKTYQKRPIYWLFDSGKKNGFKALIYMHRYQADTIARMRTDYVHEQQSRYRTAIADIEQRIASSSTSERVKLNKKLKNLQDQAAEIQAYEEKIHHLADQYISIDLDDGVKKNYAIFGDVLEKIK